MPVTTSPFPSGAPVTLHGEDSFDIDNDSFTYAWVQVDGVAVTLAGENTASPTFTAPSVGPGGTRSFSS